MLRREVARFAGPGASGCANNHDFWSSESCLPMVVQYSTITDPSPRRPPPLRGELQRLQAKGSGPRFRPTVIRQVNARWPRNEPDPDFAVLLPSPPFRLARHTLTPILNGFESGPGTVTILRSKMGLSPSLAPNPQIRTMKWIDRLEAKFGRYAVPNLTVFLIVGQALAYLASAAPRVHGAAPLVANIRSCPTRCSPASGGG